MLKKIEEQDIESFGVVSAPDKLEGDPEANKKVFDRLVKEVVAQVVNSIIHAHNELCVDVDELAEQLKNHVDIDPNNLTAENIGLLRELADKYGLTDKLAPTVHDALEVLEGLTKLQPETAKLLGLEPNNSQDDAIRFLAEHTKMDPSTMEVMGLGPDAPLADVVARLWAALLDAEYGSAFFCINARYASSGKPAQGLKFTGYASGEIGAGGTYFRYCQGGATLNFSFESCLGYKPIADVSVVAEAGKVVTVDVVLEKDDATLHSVTTSGTYFVGEDVTSVKALTVGGGGSGGEVSTTVNSTTYVLGCASGGGGGYVSEAELDLSPYIGRRITVTVGAGGSGVTKIADFTYNGNPGGESFVAAPDGTVLLRSAGGEGGKGVHQRGSLSYSEPITLSASPDDPDRQGRGVGATVTRHSSGVYSHSFEGAALSTGVSVFGDGNIVVGTGGGAGAMYSESGSATPVGPRTHKSDAGVQGAGKDGTGEGGEGAAGQSSAEAFKGGSGVVYFQVVN